MKTFTLEKTMRMRLVVGLVLVVVACDAEGDRNVSAPDVAMAGGQRRALAGGVPAVAAQGSRPVDGTGTPFVLPMWTSTTTLGDAPMKVAPNGDLLVQPGRAIWLLSVDGSKCYRLSGQSLDKVFPPNCPTY